MKEKIFKYRKFSVVGKGMVWVKRKDVVGENAREVRSFESSRAGGVAEIAEGMILVELVRVLEMEIWDLEIVLVNLGEFLVLSEDVVLMDVMELVGLELNVDIFVFSDSNADAIEVVW